MRRPHLQAWIRIAVVLALTASTLAALSIAPVRALTVPKTLARSLKVLPERGGARLDFPATHVAFSWSGAEGTGVRYRTGDGSWRRATEAHDLEHGAMHYSAVLVVDRPTELEWKPVQPKGAWMGLVEVDYMNTIDGPTETRYVPATAAAAAKTPNIVTRAEWGADESMKRTSGGCERKFYPVQQLFVHHTAGRNNDPNPAATMRAVYQYHVQSRGWCDIGYNFVIAPNGTIFEGRWARAYDPWETHSSEDRFGKAVAGAHVSEYNSGSVGISMMGNFSQAPVPKAARRSLVSMLAWEADRHDLDPKGRHSYRNPETGVQKRLKRISGHRDAGYTDCPGGYLYGGLPSIRRSVARKVGEGRTATKVSLAAAAKKVPYGSAASLSGLLTTDSGQGLVGKEVTIYRSSGGRWRKLQTLITGTDGSFAFDFSPQRNVRFRAFFDGDAANWYSQSRAARVRVMPLVTIELSGGSQDLFGVRHYPAGTALVPISGDVTPALGGKDVVVRVWATDEFGRETLAKERRTSLDPAGAYAVGFKNPDPGVAYRAVARFERTGGYASSASESVFFTVDES